MVDMKLGSLVAEIHIDNDSSSRRTYAAREFINGKVILEYKRYSNRLKSSKSTPATADLFAPLNLQVFLRGRIKIIVKQERDVPVDHGCPLFFHSVGIYDAAFHSKAEERQEFPFRIAFPDNAAIMGGGGRGGGGGMPPPSFSHAFPQFPDAVDLSVRYRIGVNVCTPGINIKTIVPEHGKQPEIRYDFPRPCSTMQLNTNISTYTQRSVVQTHMLLPEDERPRGFQQRFRAVFVSSPQFDCEIGCTELQHIWPGHRPDFTISIRRGEGDTTTLSLPEAAITSFRADLTAYTWCDCSKRLKGPFERFDSRTVQRLECRIALPLQLTKATEYSATLSMDEVEKWPSGFKHPLLVRRYFIKVKMKMRIAQQSVSLVREFEVRMVPRPKDFDSGCGEAGSSNAVPPPPYSGGDLEPYRQ